MIQEENTTNNDSGFCRPELDPERSRRKGIYTINLIVIGKDFYCQA